MVTRRTTSKSLVLTWNSNNNTKKKNGKNKNILKVHKYFTLRAKDGRRMLVQKKIIWASDKNYISSNKVFDLLKIIPPVQPLLVLLPYKGISNKVFQNLDV